MRRTTHAQTPIRQRDRHTFKRRFAALLTSSTLLLAAAGAAAQAVDPEPIADSGVSLGPDALVYNVYRADGLYHFVHAVGGDGDYTFTFNGAPSWMITRPSGLMSANKAGLPPSGTNETFSVEVTDGDGSYDTATIHLHVIETAIELTRNDFYFFRGKPWPEDRYLRASGGRGTYNYQMLSGPNWLQIDYYTGQIIGDPPATAAGDTTYYATVAVDDGRPGPKVTMSLSLHVLEYAGREWLTDHTLPDMTAGVPVAQTLEVANPPKIVLEGIDLSPIAETGLTTTRWNIVDGSLPVGTHLVGHGNTATIAGVPLFGPSQATFTVAINEYGDFQRTFTVKVKTNPNPLAGLMPLLAPLDPVLQAVFETLPAPGKVSIPDQVAPAYQASPMTLPLTGQGAGGTYRWEKVDGPAWANVTPGGTLTGIPDDLGTFPLKVKATAGDSSAIATIPIQVTPAPLILPAKVTRYVNAMRRIDVQMEALQGVPAVWTTSTDTADKGIHITPSGRITGAPRHDGTITFPVYAAASEGGGFQGPIQVSLVVRGGKAAVPSQQRSVLAGEDLNYDIDFIGGPHVPITWIPRRGSDAAGQSWFSLSSDGSLEGVVPEDGLLGIGFDAVAAIQTPGLPGLQHLSSDGGVGVTVEVAPLRLESGWFLPSPKAGAGVMNATVKVRGGRAPFTWSTTGTSLSGVDWVFDDDRTAQFVGLPHTPGRYTQFLTVTDADGRTLNTQLEFIVR